MCLRCRCVHEVGRICQVLDETKCRRCNSALRVDDGLRGKPIILVETGDGNTPKTDAGRRGLCAGRRHSSLAGQTSRRPFFRQLALILASKWTSAPELAGRLLAWPRVGSASPALDPQRTFSLTDHFGVAKLYGSLDFCRPRPRDAMDGATCAAVRRLGDPGLRPDPGRRPPRLLVTVTSLVSRFPRNDFRF